MPLLTAIPLSSQINEAEYKRFIRIADSLYDAKNYQSSAEHYSMAFKNLGWKGYINDRYNAACSWALAKVPDSAFFNLQVVANKGNYINYHHISTDQDLVSLHNDKRWRPILDTIQRNKERSEAHLEKALVQRLDSIYQSDQEDRLKLREMEKKYRWDSPEMQAIWKKIIYQDSVNLVKVKRILDSRGWLGPEVIGYQGNSTLFLVIQHSDLKTQEKYLPMMREAVKNKKAQASSLALLEDRVALGQGRKQIYGSQLSSYQENDKTIYYLSPLEDPDHVDERRLSMGLGPLSEYLSHWDLKWDPEEYKKQLPELEKRRGKK